ncbi:MAG: ABC transporter substrate-binding protein [Alphaproteobacteria bacterium]|nr:ABC transporter substrate-binding protein [Alphaproteobacteria bacterium]
MKKKIFFNVLVGLILGAVAARAEVTIAVIAPKASSLAKAGSELFLGARFAAQEINEAGGINGEKVDLLTIDDRCDDRLAISTAEMLTLLKSKKIGLVVGPYCANRFEETSKIYEKAKIFQIVPTTEAYHAGSEDKRGRLLLLGTKAQMSGDFFKFYNNNFAGLKVGFVYDDEPESGFGEVAKALSDEFLRFGKSDLLKFYVFDKASGMNDLVKSMKKDGIGIAFVLGKREQASDFIRKARKKEENMIIFTSKKMLEDGVAEEFSENAGALYVLDRPRLKDSLMFTESLVDLRLHGVEPEGLFAYGYLSVKLWGDLAKKVKSFSYDKLSKVANSEEMQEKWGEFLMHSGSINAAKYIIEMYKDGGFKQVY